MKNIIQKISIVLLSVLSLSACVKKDFDNPMDTTKIDPNLTVNVTIGEFKNKYGQFAAATKITDDWTIYGIVSADDRSGNFYKQINISDSTGGITILIDAYSLYAHYPVGRKVYVKLKDLYWGYYNKLPQLGATPDEFGAISNINGAEIDAHLIKANYPNDVPVTRYTNLAQLKTANPSMFNRLVTIDNVEFVSTDTGKIYAEVGTIASGTSRTIEDCDGNKIVLRTSGYANFQRLKTAKGKGSITALYTVYGSTAQLVIRDTTDIKFYGDRCGASTPPPTAVTVTVDSIRKMYNGADVNLPDVQIKGIVISDVTNKNIPTGNIIVQDGNKGILVYFGSAVTFQMGDSVVISLSGTAITKYLGALEIKNISANKVYVAAQNKTVTPKVITIADLVSNFSNYESTLVQVANATISGGATYGVTTVVIKDASTTTGLQLYTATGATFSGTAVPTGAKTVRGIVTPYQSSSTLPVIQELKMRNASDVF